MSSNVVSIFGGEPDLSGNKTEYQKGYDQAIQDSVNRLLNLKYRGFLGESEVVSAIEAVENTFVEDGEEEDEEWEEE